MMHSGWRRLGLFALLLVEATGREAHSTVLPEEELKAAIVLSFARFGEWPREETAAAEPVIIGVLHSPEMAAALSRLAAGKTSGGRPIAVRALDNVAEAQACHLVLIGHIRGQAVREALAALRPHPVLTIGENAETLDLGGVIHLFEQDGRPSFEVSLDALARTRLAISAKLLRLGHAVRGKGR